MKRLFAMIAAVLIGVQAGAAELGDDGLHKAPWMRDTFKDLREDLAEAKAEGKRLMLLIEQRGCIYCEKMHREVFPDPEIETYITDHYFVVQINLHGDIEVTDLDGEVLTEKEATRKWGILFTPTMMFIDDDPEEGQTAKDAAVAVMPGAFGKGTVLDMLTWVYEKRYEQEGDEDFQRYHARKVEERRAAAKAGD